MYFARQTAPNFSDDWTNNIKLKNVKFNLYLLYFKN